MTDFFEIDFHDLKAKGSGDAITVRYQINEVTYIHVVDGGFQQSGAIVVDHIRKHYDNPGYIDHVVVTHQDGDHAGGLRTVLESFEIGNLWMLRPWEYADVLIERFKRWQSVENLKTRLREIYPNLAALEEIAQTRGIPIREPFEGADIGAFTVLSPDFDFFIDLVADSEKTPETYADSGVKDSTAVNALSALFDNVISYIKAKWGDENFSEEETSLENEMSVVQYGILCEKSIMLTGDAGRRALSSAIQAAPEFGFVLPGIDHFHVPHHGSRRNLSTEICDQLLGSRIQSQLSDDDALFRAFICASKDDASHPRKAVVRALHHRGGCTRSTEDGSWRSQVNAPDREGWSAGPGIPYPDDMEE